MLVRPKNKCVNKCSDDSSNKYQYNGECFDSCPIDTEPNIYNICQIINTTNCSMSDFQLNLDQPINQENVQLAVKNYADEFFYALNHISRFSSLNFTMIVYKNSTCIDKMNANVTKIEYDSCIKQLKIDNNINENKDLIVAVIDILNGDNPITSFGFFDPNTGEKLNASKSCADKNVIMYEDIFNLLNDSFTLKLLKEQKINIFDLKDDFYNDICFHFDSPNGRDATLQDRIRSFYPDITLCDPGCKNKGVNMTTIKAECECAFQDLLSKNIFDNSLIGDNILIRESLQELLEMVNNLNLEVLACYKDILNFSYFKKNVGGFIVLGFSFCELFCFFYYYFISKRKILSFIYSLMETFILFRKEKN